MKELRLTEGSNTGFKKIINALKYNGSPLPTFRMDENRLYFAVTIYQHPEFARSGVVNGVVSGVVKPLSESESKILSCMREEPSISKKRISEKTEIAPRTVDRTITELRRRKIIDRQGSDKNGIWVVL